MFYVNYAESFMKFLVIIAENYWFNTAMEAIILQLKEI